jgi:hypothetical protein
MAIIKNSILNDASGNFAKQFIYKKYYDKTVLSVMPDMSERVLSEKQIEWNERMQLANFYAKYIYSIEEKKNNARIRLKVPAHKSLYHALVKDHLDRHKHMSLREASDSLNNEKDIL